jgi:carbon-monoxide dehydrogenase medium subunit
MEALRAAAALAGTIPGEREIGAAARLAAAEIDPLGGVQASPAYQRHLAGVLAARALRTAVSRAA